SLSGSEIQAKYIEIIGEKEVNISETAFIATNLQIGSLEKLTVSNATFSGLDQIRMSAATIALENVNFPTNASQIQLQSANGLLAPNPNTGAAVQLNYVNFVNNVTLGGSPAQNFVPQSAGGNSVTTSTDLIKIYGPSAP
ncbi:MAG: hypothetical protein ACQKBU_00595, partial [Verrucomicrobiales bacterium]